MPVTTTDLWKLLRHSRLLSAERLEQVHAAFGDADDQSGRNTLQQDSAKALAQWLLQRKLLTPYQARMLLNGRSGPFHYGDYQIQDRIRGGRLGKTFLAIHNPSRFGVHLKFASSRVAQDPRQWNTARQYIHTISPIVHGQLQRVFVLEDQAGYRFIVLERLDGTSVAEHLAKNDRLRVPEACRLVRLAALGLAALHKQRQVYGVVRPENLWLEAGGNIKLLRDAFHPPTVPALLPSGGTNARIDQVEYMAPELAHPGIPLSPATDLYALGCTLYQLLVGKVFAAGGDVVDALKPRRESPNVVVQGAAIPAALAGVLEAVLAEDATERPADGTQFADQLLPFVEPAQQTVSERSSSATLLAFEESLGNTARPAPPAPPPVVSEADDHPQIPEPPVQRPIAPTPVAATDVEEPVPSGSGPSSLLDALDVVAQPKRSKPIDRLRRKRQTRRKQAITLSVLSLGVLVIAVGFVALNRRARESLFGRADVATADRSGTPRAAASPKNADSAAGTTRTRRSDSPGSAALANYELRNDDGKLLWMTPTTGPPLRLQYVAPGAQVVLATRPRDLLASANAVRVLKSLGPEFAASRNAWEAAAGCTFEQVDQIMICLYATKKSLAATMVVRLHDPRSTDELVAGWKDPTPREYGGQRYYVFDDSVSDDSVSRSWVFYVPEQEKVTTFVMGSEALIQEVIDAGDAPPILRRELASLLRSSDRERHFSLFFTPDAVVHDVLGDDRLHQFADPQRVRDTLTWLLDDGVKVCSLSMQFGESFFVELRASGQASSDSLAVADSLRDRVGQMPDKIEATFAEIYPALYWRRVALRFPEMVRFLYKYTRVGVEDNQVIVNAILPGHAAHNLVFGAEMLVNADSGAAGEAGVAAKPASVPSVPKTIEALLDRPMDLSFDQKSLEFAIQDLATDIREAFPGLPFPFDIQILGTDLQLNGITRNQQISGFAAQHKTLADILTAIVMRANPVTTVTEPSEMDQKLIWVVGPDPADPKKHVLLITTRDAAQRKDYKLPAPFQSK